jgi:hypothetical protein
MLVSQTISSIRTILSLNAVTSMIEKYESATEEAYLYATKDVMKFGLANGTLMSSFLLSYVVVILYGSYLIYDNVRKTGCDPSGASIGAESCDPDGENVFGKYARISHYNGDPKFLSHLRDRCYLRSLDRLRLSPVLVVPPFPRWKQFTVLLQVMTTKKKQQ